MHSREQRLPSRRAANRAPFHGISGHSVPMSGKFRPPPEGTISSPGARIRVNFLTAPPRAGAQHLALIHTAKVPYGPCLALSLIRGGDRAALFSSRVS